MKQIVLKSLFIFGAITFLTGCGEEAKTKEYYDKNMEEAKAKVAECKKLEKYNEVQELDCGNAADALLDDKENRSSVNDNTGFKASDFGRKPAESK